MDFSIYEVPLALKERKLDELITDRLNLSTPEANLED